MSEVRINFEESRFIGKVITDKDVDLLKTVPLNEHFFERVKGEVDGYDIVSWISEHYKKYGEIPSDVAVGSQFAGYYVWEVTDSREYVLDELKKFATTRLVTSQLNDVKDKINSGDYLEALESIANAKLSVLEYKACESRDVFSEESLDEALKVYADKYLHREQNFIDTGFEWLNTETGGWNAKDELAYFMARPNVGKSFMLVQSIVAALKQGKRVGLYNGEMGIDSLVNRVISACTGVSLKSLNRGEMDDAKKIQDAIKKLKTENYKLFVRNGFEYPGGYATVDDLGTFIRQDELDILFVDQISLLKADIDYKVAEYLKVENISKGLRALQLKAGIPIICAVQQGRSGAENGATLNNIAGADRIGQDASLVVAFERDANGVDGSDKITGKIIKSRSGKVGRQVEMTVTFDTGVVYYTRSDEDKEFDKKWAHKKKDEPTLDKEEILKEDVSW